ncbi:hypothetical protein Q5P01_017451 [Channa striata]|uniref:PH domain-containing protein n=1 Tax=Channa striata TaxID=64152 RepID=A0AA88MD34_CHASR|nr:hypothetical protein Q5P01_017451 [Channa striata]
MSVDETKLLFEGFLQKRKDTVKIRWSTYWFRLQNTTLFFYTKKSCSASNLRGYYYIYTVQSVREVLRSDSKRFMFEVIMKNGKRKMLAAETADLRKEWVENLWQAMHLSTSAVSSFKTTNADTCEQQERIKSSTAICSHRESVREVLPARPLSAPDPSTHQVSWSSTSPISLSQDLNSEEEPTYQNIMLHCENQQHSDNSLNNPHPQSSELSNADSRQEGDYDILPIRNKICASAETEEGVYDFPLSYRIAHEHPDSDVTENIYDVPSLLLRRVSDDTIGNAMAAPGGADHQDQEQEEICWRI